LSTSILLSELDILLFQEVFRLRKPDELRICIKIEQGPMITINEFAKVQPDSTFQYSIDEVPSGDVEPGDMITIVK
jgi:hypothetical protein